MPSLYIITGSNGAGKSTAGAGYLLPEDLRNSYPVFDGDKLFEQKRKELYSTVAPVPKEARKLAGEWLIDHFESLVKKALDNNDHFAYEGHFREESSWNLIRRFKDHGYKIHLVFLGLRDQELSQLRVVKRAEFGGHHVPAYEIDLNFEGNLVKLNEHFDLIDHLGILDTSGQEPKFLLHLEYGEVIGRAPLDELPSWFTNFLPDIVKTVYPELKEEKKQKKAKRKGRRH